MARNMSFFYTQEQIRNGTKSVTRRLGWDALRSGDVVNACVKCQGLGAGGKVQVIRQIRIVSKHRERLEEIRGRFDEVVREGFPDMTPAGFISMFCKHMKCEPAATVNRIEFEYV